MNTAREPSTRASGMALWRARQPPPSRSPALRHSASFRRFARLALADARGNRLERRADRIGQRRQCRRG
jgi:hypothetical protein